LRLCATPYNNWATLLKKTKMSWADFVSPIVVCIIGTRFIYIFSLISFYKWAALQSGYYYSSTFTNIRKFTHLFHTCINDHIILSTFSFWAFAIITYVVIIKILCNHIILARVLYFFSWFLILLLVLLLLIDYEIMFIIPNFQL